MKIRIPIVVSVMILTALLCLGWRNHQRLVELRASMEDLTARAGARGLRVDADNPETFAHTSRHMRPDRRAEAKRAAAEAIAYVKEIGELRETFLRSDPAIRQRVMEETERLLALDGDQLKTLISEMMTAEETDQFQQAEVVVFALQRLAMDHPRETLELLTNSPEIWKRVSNRVGYPHNVMSTAAYGWAAIDFPAALDWLRQHRENNCALVGVMLNAAERDPLTALSIIDELDVAPKTFPGYFAGAAKSPEQRVAMLKFLHSWRAKLVEKTAPAYDFDSANKDLVFGQYYRTEGFDTATQCIEAADLSSEEIEGLTEDLEVKSGEAGRWIGWLEQKLPSAIARDRIQELMPKWREAEPEAAAAFAKEHGL